MSSPFNCSMHSSSQRKYVEVLFTVRFLHIKLSIIGCTQSESATVINHTSDGVFAFLDPTGKVLVDLLSVPCHFLRLPLFQERIEVLLCMVRLNCFCCGELLVFGVFGNRRNHDVVSKEKRLTITNIPSKEEFRQVQLGGAEGLKIP